jgi:hypothetical protein
VRAAFESDGRGGVTAFSRVGVGAGAMHPSAVAELGLKRVTPQSVSSASLVAGANGITSSVPGSLSDPDDARFSCTPKLAVVNGPGSTTAATSVHGAELKHTRSWTAARGAASVSVELYDEQVNGETLDILQTAAASKLLTPAYLAAMATAWGQPGVCAGVPFSPDAVVVGPSYGPVRAQYQGIALSGQFAPWRNGRLSFSWSATPAHSLDTVPGTTLVRGQQLYGRALHQGYLSVESLGKLFEARFTSAFVGRYNQRNLAPYHSESISVVYHGGPAAVTISANNLFVVQSGIFNFIDRRQAVVLKTTSGAPMLFPSSPLGPRTYSIRVSRSFGKEPRSVLRK